MAHNRRTAEKGEIATLVRLDVCTDSERWIVVCISRDNRAGKRQIRSVEINAAATTGWSSGRSRRRVRGNRRLIDGEVGGVVGANSTTCPETGVTRERRIIHNRRTASTDTESASHYRGSVRIEGAVGDRH